MEIQGLDEVTGQCQCLQGGVLGLKLKAQQLVSGLCLHKKKKKKRCKRDQRKLVLKESDSQKY